MSKKAKKSVVKISAETIAKHVAKLRSVAKKHKGLLPPYTWLNAHGLFRSYEVMRAYPRKFAGIKRSK